MLSQIKAIIKKDLGLTSVSTSDINRAAEDLYDNYPLEDREREVTLSLPCEQLVVIPSEIGRILMFRRNDDGISSLFNDQSWKYKTGSWERNTIDYELVSEGPLKRNILNAGPVYITTQGAETIDVSVVITGSNDFSAQITNENSYPKGLTQKISSKAFKNISAITKSELTTYDFVITDIDGRELSRIPSNKYSATYKIVRLYSMVQGLQAGYVDCLFTPPFRPFVNESDVFQCGDRYNQAIVYQYYYNIYSGQADNDSVVLADKYLMLLGAELVKKSKQSGSKAAAISKPMIAPAPLLNREIGGYLNGYWRDGDYPGYGATYGYFGQ